MGLQCEVSKTTDQGQSRHLAQTEFSCGNSVGTVC